MAKLNIIQAIIFLIYLIISTQNTIHFIPYIPLETY